MNSSLIIYSNYIISVSSGLFSVFIIVSLSVSVSNVVGVVIGMGDSGQLVSK